MSHLVGLVANCTIQKIVPVLSLEINSNNKYMVKIKVIGKLAFVKGIKEATHIGLKEAKDIADEIIPDVWKNNIATFDPNKFGWNEQTLREIVSLTNTYGNLVNVTILSYDGLIQSQSCGQLSSMTSNEH